jgi:hypothetical protein
MNEGLVRQNRVGARTLPTAEYHAFGLNVALLKISTPAFNASTKLPYSVLFEGTLTLPDIISPSERALEVCVGHTEGTLLPVFFALPTATPTAELP